MRISSFLLYYFFWVIAPAADVRHDTLKVEELVGVFYELDINGNQFDPLDWTIAEPHNCPGNGQVSAINIFKRDVYTIAEAIAAGNAAWSGKPKVNQSVVGISVELVTASSSLSDPYLAPSGRSYYKKSN